jgi:putative transposase
LLRKIKPASVAVLQKALAEFIHFYNHVRPHQDLGGLTPLEAWQGMCLSDVQQVHAHTQGQWVQAMDGLLVGYYVRC